MSMLEMISGQGSRDDDNTVHNFVTCCGYDANDDRIKPVPSGVVWDAWDKWMAEPWEGLDNVNPRTAETERARLATYHNWFAVPQGGRQQPEKGYPPDMPRYIKHTGGIPFAHVKQLMRLRTGAHHLRVETERWKQPRIPRSERVCEKCTLGNMVEDEFHLLFECPAYHHIRIKYESVLFAGFGGVSRVSRTMRTPGKIKAFMEQDPKHVAAFVWECLEYRRFEVPDLLPYVTRQEADQLGLVDYIPDTFSSDYDELVDEFGTEFDAHGA